ncbi:MAG TPA: hypothetical protein VF243_02905 [Nitrosospira sp.]
MQANPAAGSIRFPPVGTRFFTGRERAALGAASASAGTATLIAIRTRGMGLLIG